MRGYGPKSQYYLGCIRKSYLTLNLERFFFFLFRPSSNWGQFTSPNLLILLRLLFFLEGKFFSHTIYPKQFPLPLLLPVSWSPFSPKSKSSISSSEKSSPTKAKQEKTRYNKTSKSPHLKIIYSFIHSYLRVFCLQICQCVAGACTQILWNGSWRCLWTHSLKKTGSAVNHWVSLCPSVEANF